MSVLALRKELGVKNRFQIAHFSFDAAASQRNQLKRLRSSGESFAREPETGERVFQKGNDRHRVSGPQDRLQRELREAGLGRCRKRRAGGIVGFDAEALQLRCHAPRQPTVGCYQGRLRRPSRGRCFERKPERHCDGGGLFALVGSFNQRGRCKGIVKNCGIPVFTPSVPVTGGFGRRKRCRKYRGALFQIVVEDTDRNHIVTQDAQFLQDIKPVLRVSAARRIGGVLGDRLPLLFRHGKIKPRKHHHALR